jgi:CheY-like chemotaxis protein
LLLNDIVMNVEVGVGCSLFYVDDDADDLMMFKEVAASIGESVCVFELADLMLHALHHTPPEPSIVFVDLNMPTKNGFDVVQEIRGAENLKHLPIVVYSTASNRSTIDKCRALGVNLYVTKPTTVNALRKTIKDVIAIDWQLHDPSSPQFIYKA